MSEPYTCMIFTGELAFKARTLVTIFKQVEQFKPSTKMWPVWSCYEYHTSLRSRIHAGRERENVEKERKKWKRVAQSPWEKDTTTKKKIIPVAKQQAFQDCERQAEQASPSPTNKGPSSCQTYPPKPCPTPLPAHHILPCSLGAWAQGIAWDLHCLLWMIFLKQRQEGQR